MSLRRSVAFVALASLGLSSGCSVYDESLIADGNGATGLPQRPAASTEGEDVAPIVLALQNVLLSQGERWKEIGYNLDGRTTTYANSDQECLPGDKAIQVDGVGGIDNVFGQQFFPFVAGVLKTLEADANAAQTAGRGTMLLRVSGWNGTANDPAVRIELVQAAAGTTAAPEDVEFVDDELVMKADGSPAPPPGWAGADHWWSRADAYLANDLDKPNLYDDDGYIRDGVAVMHLIDRQEIFFLAQEKSVVVRLSGAVATARLTEGLDGLEDIVVAGRWSADDLEATAPYLKLCGALVGIIRTEGLRMADVRHDGKATDQECNAISMGVLFERGVKGNLEGIQAMPPLTDLCAAAADAGVP